MSVTAPRRRLKLGIVLGTVVALSALAVPTAASAAEACVPGVTVSAATQPWLDFSQSPNPFIDIEAGYVTFITDASAQVATVTPTFTQGELDALNAAILASQTTAQAALQTAGQTAEAQSNSLKSALHAAAPQNDAANQAVVDGFNATIEASQYGPALNTVFTSFLLTLSQYLSDVQTAITASTPSPAVPAILTSSIADTLAAIDGFGAYAGDVIYGGAAAQVDRSCPAALAETGLSDPTALLGGGTLLLLLGTSVLVALKRREAVEA